MEPALTFEAHLRGVSFRPIEAKAIVNALEDGAALTLQRDPHNPYDPNAIQVLDPESGEFLGFVAKEVAVDIAPHMDNGVEFDCVVDGRMSATTVILKITEVGNVHLSA